MLITVRKNLTKKSCGWIFLFDAPCIGAGCCWSCTAAGFFLVGKFSGSVKEMNEELTLERLWSQTCDRIRKESPFVFTQFVGKLPALSLQDDVLTLGVDGEFTSNWGMEYSGVILEDVLREIAGKPIRIVFEVGHKLLKTELAEKNTVEEVDLFSADELAGTAMETSPAAEKTDAAETAAETGDFSDLSGDFHPMAIIRTAEKCLAENTFANFVVGEENRYAYTAAIATAQSPGIRWNPLYIYGGSGMGKTHLIQAIANEVANRRPDAVIRYITCEEFLNEYVSALRKKADFAFRYRFRNVDILLVDDVHFLSGNKVQLQEEFFNTFNALYNDGKQIILTSDKQPSEIPGLEKRLVSRFQSGMTMQITASTFETRLAILRQMQENQTCAFGDDVLSFLAARITSNIRPLKSALMRLAVYAAMKQEVTVATAEIHLADLLEQESEEKNARLSTDAIQKAVAEYFELQVRDLTGSKRPKNIAEPRMIAMYLCRKLTNVSQQDIGAAFGGRTHATVIHAVKQVEELCRTNEDFKRSVSAIQRKLQYA